jgi:hypothetical protein
MGGGNTSTVQILLPDDPAWDSTVQDLQCDGTSESGYTCDSSAQTLPLAALVEVSQPDALETVRGSVPLGEKQLDLSVRYFPGEDAWAGHTLELATAALPVLEELHGRPYPHDPALEITERGQLDLLGYEGVFFCTRAPCSVGLSPISSDLTTLHELAHAWTENIEERWIAEGLAEFMALRAADQLTDVVLPGDDPARRLEPAFPLDEWEREILPLEASESQRERELVGYGRSLAVFQRLEERVGIEALQRSIAGLGDSAGVDSEDYFDALEEASGQRLDDLFLEWVFPPSYEVTLRERREARDMLAIVTALAEQSGLELEPTLDAQLDNWRFDLARNNLQDAADTLAIYNQARDDVEGSRSLLERIGLIGEDPDGALDDAAGAFEIGRYPRTQERAQDAQQAVEDATRTGLIRLLIVLALPLALLAIVLVAIWQRRRATRHGPSPSI